ncbi:hypothetical protein JZ751_019905 [Albula glossodonta]|uniref:C3H1-type domain-containing protein n=1 Tax=Albula glossodonta TaxID=121402 RepID=A0A8T2MYQ3_9TELE|nr:hypothetical protein JZ751_019905 [Albula glossodonta]
MDERSLEAAIETYNAQLQQVETALQAGLDASQEADLIRLKEDLRQLIELTESSLVSVKKSRLLASLEDCPAPQAGLLAERTATGSQDDEFAAFYSELEEPALGGSSSSANGPLSPRQSCSSTPTATAEAEDQLGDEDEEDGDAMSGMKVRAPYRSSWGTLEYHNAMVVGSEDCAGSEALVRVLYVHPTHKSMKPCPFFLEDKCRFMENCRFSHGEVVAVSELREFQESDLSNLQEGSSCLARHEDGIWYPAKITVLSSHELEITGGCYMVKFDSLLQRDMVVEADGIIPPLRPDHPESSESDDDCGEFPAYAKVLDSAGSEEWAPSCSSTFGGWEAHTRGIGSKLMVKMGYEFGKGECAICSSSVQTGQDSKPGPLRSVTRRLSGSPAQWLAGSVTRRLSDSPAQWLAGSVARRLSGSPAQWLAGSVTRRLSSLSAQWLAGSVTRRLSDSPAQRLVGSVARRLRLGRNAEGRVEPVLAVVLPKGKSLDQCAEIIQRKPQKQLQKGGVARGRRRGKKVAAAAQGRSNVFDFLNSKLGDTVQQATTDTLPTPRNSKDTYRGGETTKRSLNVQLFQTTERVAQTEREIGRLTQALSRQAGRDKAMVSHLEEKLSAARKQLDLLKAQELQVQQQQRKADTHKKMTKF